MIDNLIEDSQVYLYSYDEVRDLIPNVRIYVADKGGWSNKKLTKGHRKILANYRWLKSQHLE